MAQEGRAMTKKKYSKKPTIKEIVKEVNYLGGRIVQLESVVRNTVAVLENYIKFHKDEDKFKDHLTQEGEKRKSVKDAIDKLKK